MKEKYSDRDDRDIRNSVKNTPAYPSRKSIKNKYDVSRTVDEFANGLGGLGDIAIIDKYYMPGHIPSRDVMTELNGTPEASTANKLSLGFLLLGIILLLNS